MSTFNLDSARVCSAVRKVTTPVDFQLLSVVASAAAGVEAVAGVAGVCWAPAEVAEVDAVAGLLSAVIGLGSDCGESVGTAAAKAGADEACADNCSCCCC